MLVSWSTTTTTTRARSVTARSLDFSLWTVYYVMKSILPNKKIMIDDKWLERSWGIGHETRGYFLLLSIPSSPPLPSSSSPPPLPLPPFRNVFDSTPRGIDIKQSTLWFGRYRICCLPSPLCLPATRQRGLTTVLWLYFSCNRYLSNEGIARWNAFIKRNCKVSGKSSPPFKSLLLELFCNSLVWAITKI